LSREKKNLKIAIFGSSLISSYWNGAAEYFRGILKALHVRGNDVTFYEPDGFDRPNHRDIGDPEYARSVIFPADEQSAVEVITEAAEADVIVKASGAGVLDAFLERNVLELREDHRKVIFWDVDAPATPAHVKSVPNEPFLDLIPRFDAIFTYGGGPPVIEQYQRLGARTCIPIHNAVDQHTHYPVPPESRFYSDLSLLANRIPDRESRIHEFFFTSAHLLPNHHFVLGGNGWKENTPQLSNVHKLGNVNTEDLNAFNCSARLVLSVNRKSMADLGWYPPMHIFEAAGTGACLIVDKWKGIEDFLVPGKECLVAGSGEEVARLVRNVKEDDARDIGAAALKRVRCEHTYEQRAQQAEQELYRLFSREAVTPG
jgi:spore maturation protein CgeB